MPGAFARDLARQLGVAGALRWWVDQLAGVVPAAPRAAWQRRRMRPVLAFEPHRATVWLPVVRDGRLSMVERATIALDGPPDDVVVAGRAALASLPRVGGAGIPVTVALPAREVLRKQLMLPVAVAENLRQAVGYDLDRHTPFKPEELYFDARIAGRDAARALLRVDLASARRGVVDPLLRHAESWGATVGGISADGPQGAGATGLNLLPPERRPDRTPWRRWQFWLPIFALGAFGLAATVLPVWQKRDYAIGLADLADRARAQAAVSETLRAEVERQAVDYNFALERKFTFPAAVQILDDVSRLLPDDTWLTQLELRTTRGKEVQRELSLRGESANAGRLVTVLEESRLFAQAAPRSPTTKIQPGPGEIFDVGAQLKPLPAPAAAPLVVAAAPGAPAAMPLAAPAAAAGAASATPPSNGAGPSPATSPPRAAGTSPVAAPPAAAPPPGSPVAAPSATSGAPPNVAGPAAPAGRPAPGARP